ncbi:MAG: hypothetical protein ACKO1F_13425 [Flammeovirgaceae bacterium]
MKTTAQTIIEQLGGNKFIDMTGSKNFLFAELSATVQNEWLRMDLTCKDVNRLKITLCGDDTYTMHFYKQVIRNADVIITNEWKFEGVYCDQLQEIFTETTGLYTKL